jgi:hypothetical protein
MCQSFYFFFWSKRKINSDFLSCRLEMLYLIQCVMAFYFYSNSRRRRFECGPNFGPICCFRAPPYGVAYKPSTVALPTTKVRRLGPIQRGGHAYVAYYQESTPTFAHSLPTRREYCPTNPWWSLFGARMWSDPPVVWCTVLYMFI